MPSVITVDNLSKKYIIGHQKQEFRRVGAAHAVFVIRPPYQLCHPFATPQNDPTHEEFWALKDVSFDIQQGDRVGIIGELVQRGLIKSTGSGTYIGLAGE